MKSQFKALILSTIALSLMIGVAHANVGKVVVSTVTDIFHYMKENAIISKTISVTPFGFGKRPEVRALFLTAKGQSDIFVTVARNPSPSMTQMFIEIIQNLDDAAKKAVSEMPGTYAMSGDVDEAVRAAISKTEVYTIGQRALERLKTVDGLTVRSESLGTLAYKLERVGMDLQSATLGQGNSVISLVNDIGGGGASAAFQIEIGLSKNTTPEEVRAILEAIANAI